MEAKTRLMFDEGRGVQILAGIGIPSQKTFEETARLILEHIDELDPAEVAEGIVFAKELNEISQELFNAIIDRLRGKQLDYPTIFCLAPFAGIFYENAFCGLPYESELELLSRVQGSENLISAVFDLAVQLKSDAEMQDFVGILAELPAIKRISTIEYFSGLDDNQQVNLLMFYVVVGIDITQIIQIQSKLHATMHALQQAVEQGTKLQIDPEAAIKANPMYRGIMLYKGDVVVHNAVISATSELSPLILLAYRKAEDTRKETIGIILLNLVATDKLHIAQFVEFFDCLTYLNYLKAEQFGVIFEKVVTQYKFSLSQHASLEELSQICERDAEFCSYEVFIEKLLECDVDLPRRTVLATFEQAIQYPELANLAVDFLARKQVPIPFNAHMASVDAELRKHLQREYGELYFQLSFPLQEHRQMTAFLENKLNIDVSDVAAAYTLQAILFKEGRTATSTEFDGINCKQAFVLLYFVCMREHYLSDDVETEKKDIKMLEDKGKFMNYTDEHTFELTFLENNLESSDKLLKYAFYIAKSPLLACFCIQRGFEQEYEFSSSPMREYYSLTNRKIRDLMNLLHTVAIEQLDVPLERPLQQLKEELEYESCAVNSVCLLAYFEIVAFLDEKYAHSLSFATDEQTAVLYSDMVERTTAKEYGDGECEALRLKQEEEVAVPRYDSTLKHHSLYCYQSGDFSHSLTVMRQFCAPERLVDENLEYGYFQSHAPLELHQLSRFLDDYAREYINALNGLVFVQQNIYLASNEFVLLLTHVLIDLCELFVFLQTIKEPVVTKQPKIRILSQRSSKPSDFYRYMHEVYLKAFKLHTSIVAQFCDVMRHFSLTESRKANIELLSTKCQILPQGIIDRVAEFECLDTLIALYQAFENQFFLEDRLRHFEFRSANQLENTIVSLAAKMHDCSFLHTFSRSDEAFIQIREALASRSDITPDMLKQVYIDQKPLETYKSETYVTPCKFKYAVFLTSVIRALYDFCVQDRPNGVLFVQNSNIISTFDSRSISLPLKLFFAFCGYQALNDVTEIPNVLFGDEVRSNLYTEYATKTLEKVAEACAIDVMFAGVEAGCSFEIGKDKLLFCGVLSGLYDSL